jgi:hypothetical protein
MSIHPLTPVSRLIQSKTPYTKNQPSHAEPTNEPVTSQFLKRLNFSLILVNMAFNWLQGPAFLVLLWSDGLQSRYLRLALKQCHSPSLRTRRQRALPGSRRERPLQVLSLLLPPGLLLGNQFHSWDLLNILDWWG